MLTFGISLLLWIHSVSFNISVILGPPVGRSKFGDSGHLFQSYTVWYSTQSCKFFNTQIQVNSGYDLHYCFILLQPGTIQVMFLYLESTTLGFQYLKPHHLGNKLGKKPMIYVNNLNKSFMWSRYPCFRLLVTSSLAFKVRM